MMFGLRLSLALPLLAASLQTTGTTRSLSGNDHAEIAEVIVVQVLVALAMTIPFLRRRVWRTALLALTFWLAGALTVAGHPVRWPNGAVAGFFSGSLPVLGIYDVLVVSWGTCGSILCVTHLYSVDDPDELRARVRWILLGNALVVLALLALLPLAIADPWVRREGVWYPVSTGMAPGPLLHDLIGTLYTEGMFIWAAVGCWMASRRVGHSVMRFGALCGFCLVCGILAQSLAVTFTLAQHQEFFLTEAGQTALNLWIVLGFTLPMSAFFTAGISRRVRLYRLARDLRRLTQRLMSILLSADRARQTDLLEWSTQVFGATKVPLALPSALFSSTGGTQPSHFAQTRQQMWRIWHLLGDPLADVDRLSVLLHDVLRAYFPVPTEATVLAARWLQLQPETNSALLTERDVALLLLDATVIGGEQGIFERLPLPYPVPLSHLFAQDQGWGHPASARFLQAAYRLLTQQPDASVSLILQRGLAEVRQLLETTTREERSALTSEWLVALDQRLLTQETAGRSADGTTAPENNEAGSDAMWWLPQL